MEVDENFTNASQKLVTPKDKAEKFMIDCLVAVGAPEDHAKIVAEHLIQADYRGHYSCGIKRLESYIKDIENGICDPKATPQVVKESEATALIDGKNGLGAVIGKYCMDMAIKKAKKSAASLVVARSSNHYGIAGLYGLQASEKGFLGLSFTNSPYVMPKAEQVKLQRKGNTSVSKNLVSSNLGESVTDAKILYNSGKFLSREGKELDGVYKGISLGMVMGIFCGLLSGSDGGISTKKNIVNGQKQAANLGHVFIAVHPDALAPNFKIRLSDLTNYITKMNPANQHESVQAVDGEFENNHMKKVDEKGGFSYEQSQHEINEALARRLNVAPMLSKNIVMSTC